MESKYSFGFGFTLGHNPESCFRVFRDEEVRRLVVSVKARCSTLPVVLPCGAPEKGGRDVETGSTLSALLPYLPGPMPTL